MRVAVLAYHSQNVNGSTYSTNDHVALAADLSLIRQRRIPVLRLRDLVDSWLEGNTHQLPEVAIALTCDDGTLLDFAPFDHPTEGMQIPFADIVAAYALEVGVSDKGMLTSFVIASPEARREIDAGCYGYPSVPMTGGLRPRTRAPSISRITAGTTCIPAYRTSPKRTSAKATSHRSRHGRRRIHRFGAAPTISTGRLPATGIRQACSRIRMATSMVSWLTTTCRVT